MSSSDVKNMLKNSVSDPLLDHLGLNVGQPEKQEMERAAKEHGLGIITAAIFLAGEMAGSGVLALPSAMVGTGTIILLS
jgi:hypothetical protein